MKEVQRQYLDGWVTETVYAHKICYTPEKQAKEHIQQKKEQREKARVNQVNTNRLRTKKQAEQRRETLVTSITLGLALGLMCGGR